MVDAYIKSYNSQNNTSVDKDSFEFRDGKGRVILPTDTPEKLDWSSGASGSAVEIRVVDTKATEKRRGQVPKKVNGRWVQPSDDSSESSDDSVPPFAFNRGSDSEDSDSSSEGPPPLTARGGNNHRNVDDDDGPPPLGARDKKKKKDKKRKKKKKGNGGSDSDGDESIPPLAERE